MTEHIRANGFQWCDAEVCMIWDKYKDQPERFNGNSIYGTLAQALEFVEIQARGWEERMVILRLPGILAYQLSPKR